MPVKQLVVIGASAGGIEALRTLVAGLPATFSAPICVVLHTSPQSPGVLDAILSRAGALQATNARDGERLAGGHIYVAPPDYHLTVEPGRVRVTKGPRENRFRPAIDPLFRSAAQVYGPNAIGVILTGNLDDGTAGLWAVKQLGGTAIVQDPEEALFPAMPTSALRHVSVDFSVSILELPPLLVQLTSEVEQEPVAVPVPPAVEVEVKIAKEEHPLAAGLGEIAKPSVFACPECHGVLLQLEEGGRIRFRCHTGHAYSVDSLVSGIADGVEEALWNAIRALEEAEMLFKGMGTHLQTHEGSTADELGERAVEARRQAETIRRLVMEREPIVVEP
jgi:two-component system, chemotaxis family, protein-glutamate methylesterase/glutaminase